MKLRGTAWRLVPILIVLLGVFIAAALMRARPQPERAPPRDERPLVGVATVREGPVRRVISASGTVIPSRQVSLQPEVSGLVEWRSESLTPGGRVRAGEPILRIDRREFVLALEQQRAAVASARAELELERSRLAIARREWELFRERDDPQIEGRALQQREMQLQAARAALEAAESDLGRARLALERTEILAPFDAHVLSAMAEVGQSVSPQVQLATLAAMEPLWVEATLDADSVFLFDLPKPDGEGGARAHVWRESNGERTDRRGRVVRLVRSLDEGGQTARVILELEPVTFGEALLYGAFVRVAIAGARQEQAYKVPAEALRQGNRVWVVDAAGRLEVRRVRLGWLDGDEAVLLGGVEDGERVVTTPLTAAVDGMSVRATEATAKARSRREGDGRRAGR